MEPESELEVGWGRSQSWRLVGAGVRAGGRLEPRAGVIAGGWLEPDSELEVG